MKKEKKENKGEKPVKKNLFKKILRTGFLLFFILLIAFTVFLAFLTLSHPFRSFIVSKALKIANKELVAKVELGDLRVAMFRGIRLSEVRLITEGDTLLYTPEITVDFNLEALLGSRVRVAYLKIKDPVIKLIRSKDSVWNYNRIAPPSADTTSNGPTIWTILVKHAILENAKFTMYDSLSNDNTAQKFAVQRIFAEKTDIDFSADIKPGKKDFNVKINQLKLHEKRSGIDLSHFAGDISISPQKFSFKGLDIETNLGSLRADFEINNFNPFDPAGNHDFNKAELTGNISGRKLQLNLPDKFTKLPDYFDKNFSTDLDVDFKGSLENMTLNLLKVDLGEGKIDMSGNLQKLNNSDSLSFVLNLKKLELPRKIAGEFIPPESFKLIPQFDRIIFKNTVFKGNLKHIYADLDIASNLGNIRGKVEADLSSSEKPKFSGDIVTETLRLEKILNDTNFASSINTNLKFDFENTDYKKIIGSVIIDANNSFFKTAGRTYRFKTLKLAGKANSGEFTVDSSDFVFEKADSFQENVTANSELLIKGGINLNNKNPDYDLNADMKNFDFLGILQNNDLPKSFSGAINLKGSGFDIDSLKADLKLSVDEILFKDKYITPFNLTAEISKPVNNNRSIDIKSEILNLSVTGDFKLIDMAKTFANSGILTADYILRHLNPALRHISKSPAQADTFRIFRAENNEFHEGHGDIRCEVKDLSLVNTFIDGVDIYSKSSFDLHFESDKRSFRVRVDSLDIDYLDVESKGSSVKFQPLRLSLNYEITPDKTLPHIKSMNIEIADTGKLFINDLLLNYYPTRISFLDDSMSFSSGIQINETMNTLCSGYAKIGDGYFNLTVDTALIAFPDSIIFATKYPAKFAISDTGGVNISKFTVEREGSESYSVTGVVKDFHASNVKISMNDFSIKGLFPFIPGEELKNKLSTLTGVYKELNLIVNGSLDNPTTDLEAEIDSLSYNSVVLGNLITKIVYKDKNISGGIALMSTDSSSDSLFNARIIKIPINIGLNDDAKGFLKDQESRIELYGKSLPLRAAEPFIPNVANVFGKAEIDVVISGIMPDKLNYNGSLRVNNSEFLLTNTNINYRVEGAISFENNHFSIDSLNIKNVPSDIKIGGGTAFVHGSLLLDGTDIENLDLKITADRFLVLSKSSIANMPDMYGDVVFSCSRDGLEFDGSLLEPNLTGSIALDKAELIMSQPKDRQILRTYLKYTIDSGSKKVIIDIKEREESADSLITQEKNSEDSTTNNTANITTVDQNIKKKANKQLKAQPNIADLINYNLNIRFVNPISVEMDMGFGSTYSVLGIEDNGFLRYQKDRDRPQNASVTGSPIELKEKSTLTFYKTLKTTGKISFPSGNIQNPTLDITATYDGILSEGNEQTSKYQVIINITGPKNNPNFNITYTIAGEPTLGDKNRIAEDAMYLLLTGSRKGSNAGGLDNSLISQGLNAGLSQGVSSTLTNFLTKSGFIQNANVAVNSNSLSDSKFQVRGNWNNVTWSIGGSFGDFQKNNEIVIEVPMNEFIENDFWNNFIFQFTKSTTSNDKLITNDDKLWELKLKFGNSF